jgi:hypothetical protein
MFLALTEFQSVFVTGLEQLYTSSVIDFASSFVTYTSLCAGYKYVANVE